MKVSVYSPQPLGLYLVRLLAFAMLMAPYGARAADAGWQLSQFELTIGQGDYGAEGWRLRPDAEGKIYLTLDLDEVGIAETDLADFHFLRYLVDSGGAAQTYLLWRTEEQGEQLFQYRLPSSAVRRASRLQDMQGKPHWDGRATMIGVGIFSPGGQEVLLRQFTLNRPGLSFQAGELINQWAGHRPRKPVDINLYPGTLEFRKGPLPVLVFAVLFGAALLLHLLASLLARRDSLLDWRVVGVLALLCWIGLDLLWQTRLGRQALVTLEQRELTVTERVLASSDGPIFQMVENLRPFISDDHARVMLLSEADEAGMLAAYYLSPLNTFWPKKGEHLRNPERVQSGDYLLVIWPSRASFDTRRGVLDLVGSGRDVPVKLLYADTRGSLFQAI